MDFCKTHFETEGPLGLPMTSKQAQLLETLLKSVPAEDRELARFVTSRKPSELIEGERADISWISTEEIDHDKEIVISRGMNDAHFKANPIVTLQHSYESPPVGRSVWRKRVKEGQLTGVKAKTKYPTKPDSWPGAWQADQVFTLIQQGLMNGKSIGFIRLKTHAPSSHEIAANPDMAQVSRIIDEWLLLEYACVFLPCNQAALVDAVSKGLTIAPEIAELAGVPLTRPKPQTVPFITEEEISGMIKRRLPNINTQTIISAALERSKGRV